MRPNKFVVPIVMALSLVALALPVSAGTNRNFTTHLAGRNAGTDSIAQGEAIFHLSKDGAQVCYKLIVANIMDVNMAHIHLVLPTGSAPPVVWLYPSNPPPALMPGRYDGVLATGCFDSSHLVGPLAGMTIGDLVMHMEMGDTFVNVHTLAFPGGEIRGWI